MKRNILFFAVILTVILIFSSCEAILYAVYPDYDPDKSDRNSIFLQVEVENPGIDMSNPDQPVIVAFAPMVKNPENEYDWDIDVENVGLKRFTDKYFFDWPIQMLDAIPYRIFVWQDLDGNNKPGFDEPSTEAVGWNEETYQEDTLFDFRGKSDSFLDGYAYLGPWSGIDPMWLEKINAGMDDDYVDYSFHIEGPRVINPLALKDEIFEVKTHNNDLHMREFAWSIENEVGTVLTSTSESISPIIPDDIADPQAKFKFHFNFAYVTPSTNVTSFNFVKVIVKAKYDHPTEPSQTGQFREELNILVSTENPDFSISMPIFDLDRGSPGTHPMDIIFNGNAPTVNAIKWRLLNSWWEPVGVAGDWDWNPIAVSAPTTNINFGLVDPSLNDVFWDDKEGVVVLVEIDYLMQNGSILTWDNNYWLNFMGPPPPGGGYDLTAEISINNATYGYDFFRIAVVDATNYNTLFWLEGILDGSGNAIRSFNNIYDPAGMEQIVWFDVEHNGTWYYADKDIIGNQLTAPQTRTAVIGDFGF